MRDDERRKMAARRVGKESMTIPPELEASLREIARVRGRCDSESYVDAILDSYPLIAEHVAKECAEICTTEICNCCWAAEDEAAAEHIADEIERKFNLVKEKP